MEIDADMMFLQRIGEKEQLVLEADRPGVRHAFDQEVARVLEHGGAVKLARP